MQKVATLLTLNGRGMYFDVDTNDRYISNKLRIIVNITPRAINLHAFICTWLVICANDPRKHLRKIYITFRSRDTSTRADPHTKCGPKKKKKKKYVELLYRRLRT